MPHTHEVLALREELWDGFVTRNQRTLHPILFFYWKKKKRLEINIALIV